MPIDIELAPGHLLVLEGRNGAGKTTLLRALLGLHPLTAKSLHFRGDLTVRENLHYNLAIGDEDAAGDVDSLCADLGLAGYEDTPTRSLSAGQRKRAALARLAASRRPLWLLDEPFAGVDPISVSEIQRIVAHLKDRGIGVLITDHNVRETLGICDRAYILHAGTVLAEGKPSEILVHQRVREVYLGEKFTI